MLENIGSIGTRFEIQNVPWRHDKLWGKFCREVRVVGRGVKKITKNASVGNDEHCLW